MQRVAAPKSTSGRGGQVDVATSRRRFARDQGRSGALPLRNETLELHARRIGIPQYDRAELAPGVVHLSVGSFHRSHQAVYFDDLAARGERGWGVVGVGFRGSRMRDALAPQDNLYTVVTRSARGDEGRAIGVMNRYLHAPGQRDEVLAALSDDRTAVVTLTITADGYRERGRFRGGRPRQVPPVPRTAIEHLVEGLDRRRRTGRRPFTVLSCDNVPANGVVARDAVLAVAGRRDAGLAAWIDEEVAFPSSMVDRITPKTTESDIAFVASRLGVHDNWPVITEPFSQWVIEDQFCNARPPLDEVGVQFVADVAPYALIKTRLLNASHLAIGYLGSLAGLRRADEVMRDPLFARYVIDLMDREVTPLLPALPGVNLAAYKRALVDRLLNPRLADDLARLCRGGSAKVPAHLLPSIAEARDRGSEHRLLVLAVAAWLGYVRASGDGSDTPALDDPMGQHLRTLAVDGGSDQRALLGEERVFGSLGRDPYFVAQVTEALAALEAAGPRAAIAACLDGPREGIAR